MAADRTPSAACGARAPGAFGEGCEKPAGHEGFHYAKVGCGSRSWPQEASSAARPCDRYGCEPARSAATKPKLGECPLTASHTRRACDNGGSCWCIENPEEVARINAHPEVIEARSAANDYPGAVWHGVSRLTDDLMEFGEWLKDQGADVQHDPKEASHLCGDRWDGLDLDAICAALAEARSSLALLMGRADA